MAEYEESEMMEEEMMGDGMMSEEPMDDPVDKVAKLQEFMQSQNIAEDIDQGELDRIGLKVMEDYEEDDASLDEWREGNKDAIELAKQTRNKKTFPWMNASNVKYPLIGQAAMSFNARAYPEVVQGDKVVKAQVIGEDPEQKKADRAERVSDFMSWQLIEQIPNWECDTDSLLMQLPIVGTMFREVMWDEINQRPEVNLLLPDQVTVNYMSKSLDLTDCRRISKEITLFKNDIFENEQAGLWLDISYAEETKDDEYIEQDEQVFIQQLRYLDLDDDGYEEPYMVTVHKSSSRVVRIIANYDESTMFINDQSGELMRIEPFRIYTDYHFIPAFDGGFYSIGFGHYLYPINQAIDSLINQLVDAGTLANTQAGFLAKGLRAQMGSKPFQPGEWRPVDTKGMKLSESVMPLPAKEPSVVLFNLMSFLIDIGEKMSSTTDVLSGVQQGPNTPVGTTMAMIEQGMKELDAVYKRVYRALRKEYRMLYRINSIYMDEQQYMTVLDNPAAVMEGDFAMGDFDIMPVGDARISTQYMRIMKAQQAREIVMSTPGANVQEASRNMLEAMDVSGVDALIPETPDAEQLMQMVEFLQGQVGTYEQYIQSGQMQMAMDENTRANAETDAKVRKDNADTVKTISDIEINKTKQQLESYREVLNTMKLNFDQQTELKNQEVARINASQQNSSNSA